MIETVRRALRWRWPWMVLVLVPVAVVGIWWVEAQPTRAEAVSVVGVTPASVEYANPDLVQLTVNRYAVLLASPTGLQGVSDDTGIDVDELEQAVSVESSLDSANLRIVVDAATEERAEEIADAVAAHARVLGADDDATDVSVLSPAVVQAPPLTASKRVLEAVLLLIALVVALGAACAVELARPRIRTGGDAEAATGAMVVAGMRRFPQPGLLRRNVVSDDEVLRAARALRTGLLASERSAPSGPICVLGSELGAGGTTISFLLARSASDAGEAVLLIDGDLEGTGLSKHLLLPQDVGLDDVLAGRADLEAAIDREGRVPVVGTRRKLGSDALTERRLGEMLKEAAGSWERVIVDAPPVGSQGADVVGLHAASVLLVVPLGAPVHRVRRAARRLARHGIPVRGVVLNRAPRGVVESMRTVATVSHADG